jgi:hypothetical protein
MTETSREKTLCNTYCVLETLESLQSFKTYMVSNTEHHTRNHSNLT